MTRHPAHTTRTACRSTATLRCALATLAALTVCVVLGIVAGSAGAVTNGFAVTPLRFDAKVTAGTAKTYQISVLNSYSTRAAFVVTKQDFAGSQSDPYAAPVFLGGQVDSPISGADWLVPNTTSFSLDPGDTKVVNVSVNVPSGATGGHYAAIMIGSPTQTISADLKAKSQVAVLFMLNAGGVPPPELVIDDVYVNDGGDVVIDYTNNGDTAVEPDGKLQFRDPITGELLDTNKNKCGETGNALPGATGRCIIETDGEDGSALLKRGSAQLVDDSGARATAKMPIEWSGSLASLLLPLAGVCLLVFYFAFLRRRREEEEDDVLPPHAT